MVRCEQDQKKWKYDWRRSSDGSLETIKEGETTYVKRDYRRQNDII